MPQFFIEESSVTDGVCLIDGDAFHHLVHVRRAGIGDSIKIRAGGKLYLAKIKEIFESGIRAVILDEIAGPLAFVDITLACAVLKGPAFESALRKSVEVGVERIIPIITARGVADPSEKKDAKHRRWVKIAEEASKQSMRASIPEVDELTSFGNAVKARYQGLKIIGHPGASLDIRDVLKGGDKTMPVTIFVGPEGGFTAEEISLAESCGFQTANFGFTHMKAETAAVVLPAIIVYEMGGL